MKSKVIRILSILSMIISFSVGLFLVSMLLIAPLRSQVMQIAGLAVAQSTTRWNNVKDAAIGDDQTTGIIVVSPYLYDGTNFDPARGDTTNGLWVNVKSTTETSGTAFYAVKRANITTSSVNIAFGFTSKKVCIETDPGNTDEIAVDWIGGTAVAPAANTAGDDRIAAGRIVILDNYSVTSISVIAGSGTQTVSVRAWN